MKERIETISVNGFVRKITFRCKDIDEDDGYWYDTEVWLEGWKNEEIYLFNIAGGDIEKFLTEFEEFLNRFVL